MSKIKPIVEEMGGQFVSQMMEHVDSVIVFCSWTEDGDTHTLEIPGGNILATLQQVTEWRLDQGLKRAQGRGLEPLENEFDEEEDP